MIKKDPLEYAKKCTYALCRMMTEGVYYGEFFTRNSKPSFFEVKNLFIGQPLNYSLKNPLQVFSLWLSALAKRLGVIIIFISFMFFPFSLVFELLSKDSFFIFMLSALGYQIAMNALVYQRAAFTGNMYFFFILNIFYGCSIFLHLLNRFNKKYL